MKYLFQIFFGFDFSYFLVSIFSVAEIFFDTFFKSFGKIFL